jgi:hypothetical protein
MLLVVSNCVAAAGPEEPRGVHATQPERHGATGHGGGGPANMEGECAGGGRAADCVSGNGKQAARLGGHRG